MEKLLAVHLAQVITYVRLAGKPAGLLINFNEKRLVDGVRRVLNDPPVQFPFNQIRRDTTTTAGTDVHGSVASVASKSSSTD